ncbi:hypothetical protein C0995_005090 [Termitomyces sp. Mi166|nr:hypothetical protein C0995_005090 [Termitomyces sp. Mi166\
MLGAITSLVRNALPYRCKLATSLAVRSHQRHLTSPPPQSVQKTNDDWNGVLLKNPKIEKTYFQEEKSPEEKWATYSEMDLDRLRGNSPATTYSGMELDSMTFFLLNLACTSGRSVFVKSGNIGDAYGRLQSILQRNRVQAQLRLTERHEKKGVKRRRLSSERWRKQFAHEVRKKVQLVTKIRNRGA